jgi:hypothetical protein
MAKQQDLKKYCIQLTAYVVLVIACAQGCERLTACLQSTYRVHTRAMKSEGRIILIYSYFIELRVYFHPYYNMTLEFKSLGLVTVLF